MQVCRNLYGNTPAKLSAQQPDCREVLKSIQIGGLPARSKLAEDLQAAAAEAEERRLEEHLKAEEL